MGQQIVFLVTFLILIGGTKGTFQCCPKSVS
jgi:hypothetical protein